MSPVSVDLASAYVLHTRHYRDTSLLVTVLTETHGKLTLIARGARKTTKSTKNPRYLLQPFIPLALSWQGKSALKTLTSMEATSPQINLLGNRLYSAMYVNELLVYLLQDDDASNVIFAIYQKTLQLLACKDLPIEAVLRPFEFSLLVELGYGIDFEHESDHYESIDPAKHYYFLPDQGFVLTDLHPDIRAATFSGQAVISIGQRDYHSTTVRQAAKSIARIALSPHLKNRQLKSRELFMKHE
ncbi:DNA repair protein RecO [Eionea flava]